MEKRSWADGLMPGQEVFGVRTRMIYEDFQCPKTVKIIDRWRVVLECPDGSEDVWNPQDTMFVVEPAQKGAEEEWTSTQYRKSIRMLKTLCMFTN